MRQAREAAGEKDIRIGGGVSTIQQYLRAHLIDELHLAIASVFLGAGENLFAGVDLRALGYSCSERVSTADAIHLIVNRQH